MPGPSATRFYLPLLVILLALLAIETAFLPMPGVQEDEALFVLPFLSGHAPLYSWTAGHARVPVMLMDYVGALKSWIYWPIFQLWRPNVWSMRLPVCLLSLLTVWMLAEFLRRAANPGVALLTALLLATDAPFVLTNVFDWGPVCLLLLGTALFLRLFQRFLAGGNRAWLGAAFLVAGMATWYKTLFLVVVAALALSFLVVFGRRFRQSMRAANVLVAALCFAIGAMPLIAFNWQRGGGTFTAARDLPAVAAGEKLMMLRHTLDGRALEHYMFRSLPGENIQLTGATPAEVVTGWYRRSSLHPASLLWAALILSLCVLPFLRTSTLFPPLLFSWIAFAAAETAMLLFRDAGAAPHHTVLLYPAPQFIVAATGWAVAERRRRPLPAWAVAWVLAGASLVGASLVSTNLGLLRAYYERGQRNGFSVFWTDGVGNLANAVASAHLPAAILDWGIQNGVQVETRDQVAIVEAAPVRPGVLYVAHCDGYILDPSRSQPYLPFLRQTRIVTDRHGAPLFCLFEARQ